MGTHHFTRRMLQLAVGSSLFATTTLLAQDRALVTWTGRVDKEVLITIRDTSVATGINGGAPASMVYFDVKDRMPRRDGSVRVELDYGRGDVDVVQQPSAANDYAAVIRIRDHSVGVDNYELRAFWNPSVGEDRYSTAAWSASVSAPAVAANTMHWSGSVDRELKVEWRGYSVQSINQSGETAREVHTRMGTALPAKDARVEILVREGRGDVSIVQQPSLSNGYTAIFKIRDPSSGFGHYDFDVVWR